MEAESGEKYCVVVLGRWRDVMMTVSAQRVS